MSGIVDQIARVHDRVYFLAGYERLAGAAPGLPAAGGLFSISPELGDPVVHEWWDGPLPDSYVVLAGGQLFWASWKPSKARPRRKAFFGPLAGGLDDTWWPLPRWRLPELGDRFFG